MNKRHKLIILSIAILVIVFLPYFIKCHSCKPSSLAIDCDTFHDYISNAISFINLLIFIFLTFYISNLDKKKSENELNLQKKLLITQFRQSEIDFLYKKMNDVFDNIGTEEKPIIINKILNASIILTDFINQKSYLFPILKEDKINQKAMNIIEKLSEFVDIINETYGLELDEQVQKRFEVKLQHYIFMKNEFIENLQLFTLKDLD